MKHCLEPSIPHPISDIQEFVRDLWIFFIKGAFPESESLKDSVAPVLPKERYQMKGAILHSNVHAL